MKTGLTFQETVLRLKQYWSERGCIVQEPYDLEVGAGQVFLLDQVLSHRNLLFESDDLLLRVIDCLLSSMGTI